MNLQGITIIFVIIFLPIILITTFYIQQEVDTIAIQTSYDTKLIDATTDAISAFEINTANEDLSQSNDMLRSMLEASTNVFTNTLATNLGMSSASQNRILPYIPAIVYTLYDGYYIYSPTQSPKVLTDEKGVYLKVGDYGVKSYSATGSNFIYEYDSEKVYDPNDSSKEFWQVGDKDPNYGKILYCKQDNVNFSHSTSNSSFSTVNPDEADFETKYMLKTFIPYSMRYKNGNYDVTINYTLDNFISISGNIGDVYYTKSGYLIDTQKIYSINNDTNIETFLNNNIYQDNVDSYVDSNIVEIKFTNGITISTNDNSATSIDYKKSETLDNVSAVKYYLKAYIFSKWVEDNLGNINENDILDDNKTLQNDFNIKQNGLSLDDNVQLFYEYTGRDIFKTNGAWEVGDTDSNFYDHKTKVIKNSIQYNLNLAMAVYNAGQGDEYYQMPILSEPEWDRLLSNVSMLTFMQGLPCGLKTYNNYAIVTSTNNEIMANENDIYYVPISNSNSNSNNDGVKTSANKIGSLDTAHKIDCVDKDWIEGVKGAMYFQAFPSKEVKYDKVYDSSLKKYVYDHVVNDCYYCIVNSNYGSLIKDAIYYYEKNNTLYGIQNDSKILKKYGNSFYDKWNSLGIDINKLLQAKYIAIGKIRNNLYKSIEYEKNYGIKTEDYTSSPKSFSIDKLDDFNISDDLSEYSEIDITFSVYTYSYSPVYLNLGGVSIPIKSYNASDQTVSFSNFSDLNKKYLTIDNPNNVTINKIYIKSITYKYK